MHLTWLVIATTLQVGIGRNNKGFSGNYMQLKPIVKPSRKKLQPCLLASSAKAVRDDLMLLVKEF